MKIYVKEDENIEKINSQIRSLSNWKLKGNPNQLKLLESLSAPAFTDYITTERAEAGRPNLMRFTNNQIL